MCTIFLDEYTTIGGMTHFNACYINGITLYHGIVSTHIGYDC